jgi:hypothetical protein
MVTTSEISPNGAKKVSEESTGKKVIHKAGKMSAEDLLMKLEKAKSRN